jgi:hypothetical protein
MSEIRKYGLKLPEPALKAIYFCMRSGQQPFIKAKLIHKLKRGRMNCVSAKIAEKIDMFFEDNDIDAASRQEISKHYAGGTAASNATLSFYGVRHE